MARLLLIIIAIVLIVLIVGTATGFISIFQTQEAQAPKFDVEVKQVGVGTTTTNVQVPTVGMETKQVEVPTVTVGDANQADGR